MSGGENTRSGASSKRIVAIIGGSASDRQELKRAIATTCFAIGEASAASLGVVIVGDGQEDVAATVAAWRERVRGAQVVAIGPPQLETAISALTSGAVDYLPQPLDFARVVASLAKHAAQLPVPRNVRKADLLIGESTLMREVLGRIERAASSSMPVLIHGESGVGKELAARATHYTGTRRRGPFVAINAGAIAESLAEAELFGAKRGAFTGADRDRPGVFLEANGGTLFFDEIGTAPQALQIKLLRVLERGEVVPVGSARAVSVDVRVVAATNSDPQRLVESGILRADLYYRLAGLVIGLPPLRARIEDLPLIVAHHLALIAARAERPVPRVSAEALAKLARHDWPGNVRELVHVLAAAMLSARGDILRADDLALPNEPPISSVRVLPFREARQQFEAEYVRRALAASGGSIAEAARLAHRERKDFYELCRRAGVSPGHFRVRDANTDSDDEPFERGGA